MPIRLSSSQFRYRSSSGARVTDQRARSEPAECESEWAELTEFATNVNGGATLAFVYDRRRQGKTFLLQSLVEVTGGLMFGGLQMTEAQNLDRFAEAYREFRGLPPGTTRFATWDAAIDAVFALGEDTAEPVVVIIDEFPYLLESTPGLPSVIQSALSPRGRARRRSRTRLVLRGSALTTMRGLLSGSAPLRGRAVKELMVHPFGFREAAGFWGIDDLNTRSGSTRWSAARPPTWT
jgi:AAA+ ATPase superfamily predicted ATPase